jgi:hypothetical protein
MQSAAYRPKHYSDSPAGARVRTPRAPSGFQLVFRFSSVLSPGVVLKAATLK